MIRMRRFLKNKLVHFQQQLNGNCGIILMYHRITTTIPDPWFLNVSPENFAEQMDCLSSFYNAVSIDELVRMQRHNDIPPNTIAITFDDGYQDNFCTAGPILQDRNVPATFYIVSGHIDNASPYWWDMLADIVLTAPRLPEILKLDTHAGHRSWTLEQSERDIDTATVLDSTCWSSEENTGTRIGLYFRLWQTLIEHSEHDRLRLMDKIFAWANHHNDDGLVTSHHFPSLRSVSIPSIANHNLFSIGAHTVTHPKLDTLSIDEQRIQMHACKTQLESVLNKSVTSFSYPYGNYMDKTPAIAEEIGFANCCTTTNGLVWKKTNLHLLPRFAVENISGAELHSQIQTWLH